MPRTTTRRTVERSTPARAGDAVADARDQARDGHRAARVAAGRQRALQAPRVPAAGAAQDGDAQPRAHANERSSTAGAGAPPWKLRPLAVFVKRAPPPGLNSSGSIA